MAATVTVFSAFLAQGDHCILTDTSYGGTNRVTRMQFKQYGIDFSYIVRFCAAFFVLFFFLWLTLLLGVKKLYRTCAILKQWNGPLFLARQRFAYPFLAWNISGAFCKKD